MSNNEIKPSFSLNYLLLSLITALVVSGAGLVLTKYFEGKPKKEIFVFKNEVLRLIGGEVVHDEQIEAQYFLRQPNGERKKIENLFKTKVFVKNGSDTGVDNLDVSISLNNSSAFLVSNPKISFEPKEIESVVNFTKDPSSSDKKHIWHISLLNPGESIALDYGAYSEGKIDALEFSVLPRKKDWTVVTQTLSPKNQTSELSWKNILAYIAATLTTLIVGVLLVALPFYTVAWILRSDYRTFYRNFFTFYRDHNPRHLFESEVATALRFKKELDVPKKIKAEKELPPTEEDVGDTREKS